MARYLKKIGTDVYLDGLHLLSLCQKLVREAVASRAAGSGTADNPYTLKSCGQWIDRWRVSGKEKDVYYKVAGRLILKNQKLYVGDVGPAYLKGASREDSFSKAGVQPERKDEWLKKNTINDPTYQTGAQRFVDPGLIYPESTNTLEMAGGNRPAPWNNIKNSPKIARAIRALLKGEPLALGNNTGTYDKDYSRKQFMLPVYTMAIFHSEPARNERAWPINLMLLDLSESATANFTWDAILWHPEAINPASHEMVMSGVMGPKGKDPAEREMVPVTSTKKLHLVGGLLPASPTGGGERGKPSLFRPAKELSEQQINRGMVAGPGNFMPVPFDYIHQKEIDVLFKWLLHLPQVGHSWSVYEGNTVPANNLLRVNDILQGSAPNNILLTNALMEIKNQIRTRAATLDRM